jgi:hypothetical protein
VRHAYKHLPTRAGTDTTAGGQRRCNRTFSTSLASACCAVDSMSFHAALSGATTTFNTRSANTARTHAGSRAAPSLCSTSHAQRSSARHFRAVSTVASDTMLCAFMPS